MSSLMNSDRTVLVPSHQGSHVFPNSPLFSKLLRHARKNRTAVRDLKAGVSKTYGELLDAVLYFREVVRAALPLEIREKLGRGEEVYIGVLAAAGYEFSVGVLAVLALGAAIVPMFPSAPVDELLYLVTKSQQAAILSSNKTTELAESVARKVEITGTFLPHIGIFENLPKTPSLSPLDMSISSNAPLDDSAPGIVIFTSGTTGRPKGVVLRRNYTHETALAIGDGYDIDHHDVLLHVLPVHHTTGLGTSFFPFLCAGACIEFHGGGKFDAESVWNRWLHGGLTVFSGVPTIYMRLMRYFENNVARLPQEQKSSYIQAAKQFRAFLCGSSALQENVQDFWTTVRGQPILTRYGASEFPGCLKVPVGIDPRELPKNCVGLPVPGVEVKLSEGTEGELLVKSPYMFAKYLGDPEATINAHDEDGWFRTGDIARRKGRFYFIVGRASIDIIKSGGYKISAIDVERECLTLPYVEEAMVVGVSDEEYGQRVAAVIALKSSVVNVERGITIAQLRSDLRSKLAGYKLPTLLRVVNGELPKGPTGKVQKKILGPALFPSPGYEKISDVQAWKRRMSSAEVQARL